MIIFKSECSSTFETNKYFRIYIVIFTQNIPPPPPPPPPPHPYPPLPHPPPENEVNFLLLFVLTVLRKLTREIVHSFLVSNTKYKLTTYNFVRHVFKEKMKNRLLN